MLFIAGELVRLQTAENTSVQLKCPSSGYNARVWYWGLFTSNADIVDNRPSTMYIQVIGGGVNTQSGAPSETTVDADTFTMTISPVTLHYNSNFTCRVTSSSTLTLHNIELQVYSKYK